MSGERDLSLLLATMQPSLSEERYVFLTGIDRSTVGHGVQPIMSFLEKEGLTWIVTQTQAAQLGLAGAFPSRMITLNVHSSLEAVGFLSAIATALAARGISANAGSAFYHDHLFVPADKAIEAMDILRGLCANARHSLE